MATNEDKTGISKKVQYLGLDLDKIPDVFKKIDGLEYKAARNYDEKSYKVYRYLDIKDIKILLTPKNRLDSIATKYANAVPLYAYLIPEKEEYISLHTRFLKMLNQLNVEDIGQVEREQEVLNEKIPFTIKYDTDYLWQIHYSEYTNQYFMLVPTEEQKQDCFFYLLKKQLEKKKKKGNKVFVPICYSEYSGEYLKRSEIEELERYMNFFTKRWPFIYEVYDKDENLTICITGSSLIYENMESDYNIKLKSKEEAIKFYKLVKALFILQTELPHYYKFDVKLDKEGQIEFYDNTKKGKEGQIELFGSNQQITYEYSSEFIKQEYLNIENEEKALKKEKKKLEKKLEAIKLESSRLDLEYLKKEREIALYLECKKTFFGKVKYYFIKKKKADNEEIVNEESDDEEQNKTKEEGKRKSNLKKNYYTIEDLIERYKELDLEIEDVKNMKLDIVAGEHRNKNMKLKVRNATLFLEEIDNHTKSIFEFWKFANKDKIQQLEEGTAVEQQNIKLKKTFNYELDMENFAIDVDKQQRNKFSKDEINSIFIATTNLIEDINKVAKGDNITAKKIEELRKQMLEEKRLLEEENFDIFGNISSNQTMVNKLANKKHRETRKDKDRILDINRNTTNEEYQAFLEEVIENIRSSLNKMSFQMEIPIYCATAKKGLDEHFNRFNINSENIAKQIKEMEEDKNITIYKINLKEGTNVIGLTNIMYYDNANQTLPLGMDETQEVLIDKSLMELELKSEQEIRMVCYKENEMSDITIKTIKVEEYSIKETIK